MKDFMNSYTPKIVTMFLSKTKTLGSMFTILASFLSVTLAQTPQGSIQLSLMHRDSSLSPLFKPHDRPYDRVKGAFVRSKARLAYLINRGETGDFLGEIEANDGEYFVKYSTGTPPVQMLAVLDTASELVLTRCMPCTNCNNIPLFDSSKSQTYTKITCKSSNCTLMPNSACDSSSICTFVYGYADFSDSNSFLGSDVFAIEASNGTTLTLQDVIFGCKYDNENIASQYNGIFGLGLHDLSLIMQMRRTIEPKFTYCLGNYSDPETQNILVLGNGVFLEEQTTTLKVNNGRYNLLLDGISVGKKPLPIEPEKFQVTPEGGGVIIDTGTILTFLEPDGYYVLAEELEKQLELDSKVWPDAPFERCYNGRIRDLKAFHGVVFHFDRDVNVLLDVHNLFLQVKGDLFCSTVLPSPVRGTTVLGTLFQQSYSVGYNLDDMLISFQRIDCELVEKHLSN